MKSKVTTNSKMWIWLLVYFTWNLKCYYGIAFGIVNGHRCLDEHGLTEIWSSNPPQTNSFKIKGHCWHNEIPLSFSMGNDNEWSFLIVTGDECLEVICRNEPSVGVVGRIASV